MNKLKGFIIRLYLSKIIDFLLNKSMNPKLMFSKFNCYKKHTQDVSKKLN